MADTSVPRTNQQHIGRKPTAIAAAADVLNDLQSELGMARSSVDVLHDVFSIGDQVLIETVSQGKSIAWILYDVLERLREAESLADKLFEDHAGSAEALNREGDDNEDN